MWVFVPRACKPSLQFQRPITSSILVSTSTVVAISTMTSPVIIMVSSTVMITMSSAAATAASSASVAVFAAFGHIHPDGPVFE